MSRTARAPWIGCLCLVACLQPTYEECGDILCPQDRRCVQLATGPTCAAHGGCEELPDGTACDPGDGHDGSCRDTLCVAAPRCGDAVLDTGELCDCGDATPTRPDCNDRNNSDTDVQSPCRADCTPRRCGDGIVDAFEQCEGADLQAATCHSLGFYRGELACTSFCTFTGCSGRCGDNVLDTAELEFCEPSLAGSLHGYCADFGFGSGRLQCSPACGPSFALCHDPTAFIDVLPGQSGLFELVTDHAGGGWAIADGEVVHYRANHAIDRYPIASGGALDLASFGDRAMVSTRAGVHIYDGTGEIGTFVPSLECNQIAMTGLDRFACFEASGQAVWCEAGSCGAPLATGAITEALAVDDGTIYASAYPSGTVHVTAQAVTPTSGHADHIATLHDYGGTIYGGLAYGSYGTGGVSYGLVLLDGGAWKEVAGTVDYRGIEKIGGHTYLMGRYIADAMRTPTRLASQIDPSGTRCLRIVETAGATALCLTEEGYHEGHLLRFAGATVSQLDARPLGSVVGLAVDELERAYVVDGARFGTSLGDTPIPPNDAVTPINWTAVRGDRHDAIVLTGIASNGVGAVATWSGTSWTLFRLTGGQVSVAVPDRQGGIAIATNTSGSCAVRSGPAAGPLQEVATLAFPCPRDLWVSPSGTVWSATTSEIRNLTTGDVFANAGSGKLAGWDDTHLWATQGPKIMRWNGTAWSVDVEEQGATFDWLDVSDGRVTASSGGTQRVGWLHDGTSWSKLRLPSDPTVMKQPIVRASGIYFIDSSAQPRFSLWMAGWP